MKLLWLLLFLSGCATTYPDIDEQWIIHDANDYVVVLEHYRGEPENIWHKPWKTH